MAIFLSNRRIFLCQFELFHLDYAVIALLCLRAISNMALVLGNLMCCCRSIVSMPSSEGMAGDGSPSCRSSATLRASSSSRIGPVDAFLARFPWGGWGPVGKQPSPVIAEEVRVDLWQEKPRVFDSPGQCPQPARPVVFEPLAAIGRGGPVSGFLLQPKRLGIHPARRLA